MDILINHFGQLRGGFRQWMVETSSLKERRVLAAKLELLDEIEQWMEENDVAGTTGPVRQSNHQT